MKTFLITIIAFLFSFTSAYAGSTYYTKTNQVACISEQFYDDFTKFGVVDNDTKAQQKMIDDKLCFWMKAGIPCYIVESRLMGKVKIRPEGFTIGVWTATEAITTSAPKPFKLPGAVKAKKADKDKCYDLGRRFGRCFAMSLSGKKCDPKDDVAIPPECRNTDEKNNGVKDGTEEAMRKYGR